MGRSEPPYLYDAPQRRQVAYPYSDYNPRAATQAVYQTLVEHNKPKPKRDGPLINFNQHPDSYMIVPGSRIVHDPMPPNTKKKVTIIRWVQLGLRIINEIAALGLLVATICITNTEGPSTYMLRIPPGLDALVTLYAVYHLLRPAKARTPASSASYHFFALFMDVGLCPFYAYVALTSNQEYTLSPTDQTRWGSFFSTDSATSAVLFSTFAGSVAVGALHIVTAIIGIWLILLFRRISNLPPDMNPLEDNLTARPSIKHKHKNSEYTLTSDSSSMTEEAKRLAHWSTSTLAEKERTENTLRKDQVEINSRSVPFGHSRMNSDNTFSAHTPESARWSRQQYDSQKGLYDGVTTSPTRSRWEIGPERRTMASTMSSNPYAPRTDTIARSQVDSFVGQDTQRNSHHSSQKEALLNDSWYVADKENMPPVANKANMPPITETGSRLAGRDISRHDYAAMHKRHDSFEPSTIGVPLPHPLPEPLKMNPPTPPIVDEYPDPADDTDASTIKPEDGVARSGTVISHATASSVYSDSVPALDSRPKNATPKGKYYGDLASATRGVRGSTPVKGAVPGLGRYGVPSPQVSRSPSPPKKETPGRVVSRTGADIADADLHLPEPQTGFGMRNRRDVSGKVAEEGRGGGFQNGTWAAGRLFR